MRKYIKKQVLEIFKVMGQANEWLKYNYESGGKDCAADVLSDQQEAAVRIGETVEQTEGEEHQAVALLQEYCELLWQISQNTDKSNYKIFFKKLKKRYIQIENCLKWEIPEQYEVVFLPYKASMWDSLESVWMAAKEDNRCSCHVIPIPYYGKNPDGSFRELFYEGEMYPDYVPITNYHDYNLEDIHPEVIFIHNPYDQYNYMTSVAPEYYSSKLKDQTDMLVYIPYYIMADHITDDQCVTMGVQNAHKVIVQSEAVRQVFLQALKKQLRLSDQQALEAGLNHKIVALGSPKIDRVICTIREDTQ